LSFIFIISAKLLLLLLDCLYWDAADCYVDEDECDRSRGQVCPPHSRCENTHGSFTCICDPGFQLDVATTTCQGQYTLG